MREAAVRQGLSVSEYGIAEVETGIVHAFATEEEVYGFLGYEWIPPELRENRGELEAARAGSLPDLVDRSPTSGATCTPTRRGRTGRTRSRRWSPRPCAAATRTTRSATTRTASATGGSQQQAEAIDALERARAGAAAERGRGEHPRERRGRRRRRRSSRRSTGSSPRCTTRSTPTRPAASSRRWRTRTSTASAISPAARSAAASRPPIDVERVIEKALETGTFLEINSQPDRLDLTDVHARAAREAGLKLVIDSDGHQIAALGYVELGVGQARRAWLTAADVAEHAHLEADREAAEAQALTFRDDLAATSEWVAAYLETAGERPGLPGRRAGRDPARGCRARRRRSASRSPPCCATSTR